MEIKKKKNIHVKLSMEETKSFITAFHVMEKIYHIIFDEPGTGDPELIRIKNKNTGVECEGEDFYATLEQLENILDIFENPNDENITLILKEKPL